MVAPGTRRCASIDDFTRQVRVALEEHRRGHHLRDAGDRALVLRVLFPEHLVGLRVVDDRGRGPDIRDHRPAIVDLVARRLRFEPQRTGPCRACFGVARRPSGLAHRLRGGRCAGVRRTASLTDSGWLVAGVAAAAGATPATAAAQTSAAPARSEEIRLDTLGTLRTRRLSRLIGMIPDNL